MDDDYKDSLIADLLDMNKELLKINQELIELLQFYHQPTAVQQHVQLNPDLSIPSLGGELYG